MNRGIGWRHVVLAVAVLSGCGAQTSSTISAGPPVTTAAWKTVRFGTAKLDVPSKWPVYDLTKDSKICVRFNVEAVYLGAQGPEPNCPARLLGRTDAVQIQALDQAAAAQFVTSASIVNAKGQLHQDEPSSSTTRSIVAAFPKLGVLVTASFLQDPSVAQRIVDSVDAA